jgi:hypothetical protein
MSDVTAAALWTLALVVSSRTGWRSSVRHAVWTGLASGAATSVRPNLVPLCAIVALGPLVQTSDRSLRARFATAAGFGAGALPGLAIVAMQQWLMYGGPLTSGYGDLGTLFEARHVVPNLTRYVRWLVETETVVIVALAATVVPTATRERWHAWWLLAFAAAVLVCYLPYTVFDDWWYLRFLLPALPPLLVLSTSLVARATRGLGDGTRSLVHALIVGTAGYLMLTTALDRGVFGMRAFETRFKDSGEYVADALPANAVVVAAGHSGSVRFYSRRPTLVWTELDPTWLDRAVAHLRSHGYSPYLVLEPDEEDLFRSRFAGRSPIAGLAWLPMANLRGKIRIYQIR